VNRILPQYTNSWSMMLILR